MANNNIDIKQDSKPVLQRGTATPYLAIFNSQLSVIRDPKSGLPIGSLVTLFEYTYDEEKIDKGKIELETDNPDLIALTELSYGQGLQLQWGYIYPDKTGYYSPVRKVIITDNQVVFGPQGVKITIEFSDSSILLKNLPSSYYDNTKGFVEYVKDLCKGLPIGIALVDYNESHQIRPAIAKRTVSAEEIASKYPIGIDTGAEWATELPTNAISPTEMVQVPTTVVPDAVGVKILDYNPETQQLAFNDSDNFRKVYLEETMVAAGLIVGTSRSKYYQLQDLCRSISGGPYFVDSRDGQIVLHNVKSQRNITKVYTYMGGYGELIEFSIKSSFVKTSTEIKQSTEINPDTKAVETNFVQAVLDPNSGNPDTDGVDTFMIWPNLGTQFLNQRGGTVDPAPNSAAFQPIGKPSSKPSGSPTSSDSLPSKPAEYHVMWDYKATSQAIKAAEEKPSYPNYKTKFNSISQARKYYLTHPEQVSQGEIYAYFNKWITDWNSKKTATDPTSLGELAHQLDRIPPMQITRHITIQASVDLETLGGSLGLKNQEILDQRTETFANAVLSGQVDLSKYSNSWYVTPDGDGIKTSSMIMGGTYRRNAEALLASIPGISISNPDDSVRGRLVTIETDIVIDMNGVDVVSGADTINLSGSMCNDVVEKVTNKVKATAKVIGDPVLESSMNIQIQNVSSKFTGLWYTKKVTHTISSSDGYMCNIEFVQRTVPVSTVTLKSNWTKKDYGKQILSAMKQAAENKTYNRPSAIERKVKNHLKSVPNYSFVAQVDPTTGKVIYSQRDMVSGDYVRRTDGSVDYRGDNVGYAQDLQKKVDKL